MKHKLFIETVILDPAALDSLNVYVAVIDKKGGTNKLKCGKSEKKSLEIF